MVEVLRAGGRPASRVAAAGFLRPASLRLERGRTDADALMEDALDGEAMRREVLDPLGPAGSGRYLPSRWDPVADRATRAAYLSAPQGAVVVVDGAFLLAAGLPFDTTVHLALTPAALLRRGVATWAVPAYSRYAREHRPADRADMVVRWDDPVRPALLDR